MSKTLLFFQSGHSDQLSELLQKTRGEVSIYPLTNATSDHRFLHAFVRDFAPRVKMVDLNRAIGQTDRYQHLDDYVSTINEWSLRPSSLTGLNLRQSLSFQGEVSAWWFLACTEKATGSQCVELFKMIFVLRKLNENFSSSIYCGESAASSPYSLVANGFGIPFHIESMKTVRKKIDAPVKGTILEMLRNLLLRRTLSKAPKDSITILSDYPTAWNTSADRYLGEIGLAVEKKWPGRVHTLLQLGLGPALFFKTSSQLRKAIEFAKRMARSSTNRSFDVLDSRNRLSSLIRTKIWSYRLRRSIDSQFRMHAFGKIEYLGIDLTDYFVREIRQSVRTRLPELLAQGLDTSRYLKKSGSRLCFYRNEFYCYGRVHSWACARAGVPGFGIQHGIINAKYGVYQFHRSELQTNLFHQDMVMAMPSPVRFGVWGEWYRDRITESSDYPSEALPIIGSERTTSMLGRIKTSNRNIVRESLGLGRDSFVVLFTVQDVKTLEAVEIIIRGITDSVHGGNDILELVFKLHPFHQTSMKAAIDTLLPEGILRSHFIEGDLAELVFLSDVVVTAFSATGVEALLLGKPVITVQIPTLPGDSSFRDFSSEAYEVSTSEELTKVLGEILSQPKKNPPLYRENQSVLVLDPAVGNRVLYHEVESLLKAQVTLKSWRPRPKDKA